MGAFASAALLISWLTAARKEAETALRSAHDDLERRVSERTSELSKANLILEEQIAGRKQAEEKIRRLLDEVLKLYQLSRAIIATPDPEAAISSLAEQVVTVFRVDYCAVFVPSGHEPSKWARLSIAELDGFGSFTPSLYTIKKGFQTGEIKSLIHTAEESEQESANEESVDNSNSLKAVTYLPLKIGHKLVGVMVIVTDRLERETMEAIAGLVALAYERAAFLQEVSRTEGLRQSDALKSVLLAIEPDPPHPRYILTEPWVGYRFVSNE